jgi:hypothetical protein
LSVLTLLALLLAFAIPSARVGVSLGVSVDEDGLKGFYLAIGEHYQVAEKEVVVVRERNIPDEELAVVFFLAGHTYVEPSVTVELRLGSKSWMDIALYYKLSPGIFYVAFDHDPGPPYGNARGHFKKRDRAQWGSIRLVDADIINIVNLKFVAERYGYAPAEIVKIRARGDHFAGIHKQAKANKGNASKKNRTTVASGENAKARDKKKNWSSRRLK